jgi:hypothetical protein
VGHLYCARSQSAVFMGDEEKAFDIVRANYRLFLFARGTYRLPLLNRDGTQANDSEQVYWA